MKMKREKRNKKRRRQRRLIIRTRVTRIIIKITRTRRKHSGIIATRRTIRSRT